MIFISVTPDSEYSAKYKRLAGFGICGCGGIVSELVSYKTTSGINMYLFDISVSGTTLTINTCAHTILKESGWYYEYIILG